jgi:hypothetical protein
MHLGYLMSFLPPLHGTVQWSPRMQFNSSSSLYTFCDVSNLIISILSQKPCCPVEHGVYPIRRLLIREIFWKQPHSTVRVKKAEMFGHALTSSLFYLCSKGARANGSGKGCSIFDMKKFISFLPGCCSRIFVETSHDLSKTDFCCLLRLNADIVHVKWGKYSPKPRRVLSHSFSYYNDCAEVNYYKSSYSTWTRYSITQKVLTVNIIHIVGSWFNCSEDQGFIRIQDWCEKCYLWSFESNADPFVVRPAWHDE